MKKRLTIIFTIIGLIALMLGCEDFVRRKIGGFAGSYPHVSTWTLDGSEQDVLRAIVRMKVKNPELQVPLESKLLDKKRRYWTFAKFYYEDTHQSLTTWTRPHNQSQTTFALVCFQDTIKHSKHVYINRDFLLWNNIREIRKFERLIVEPLERNLKLVKEEQFRFENYWVDTLLAKEREKWQTTD